MKMEEQNNKMEENSRENSKMEKSSKVEESNHTGLIKTHKQLKITLQNS